MSLESKLNNTKPVLETNKIEEANKKLAEEEQKEYKSEDTNIDNQLALIRVNEAQKELEIKNAHLKGIEQDQNLRNTYAKKAYGFVRIWSVGLFILLMLSGIKELFVFGTIFTFSLTDSVLIALITGVTVNILAAFLTVINNLFPSSKKNSQIKKQPVKKPKP